MIVGALIVLLLVLAAGPALDVAHRRGYHRGWCARHDLERVARAWARGAANDPQARGA